MDNTTRNKLLAAIHAEKKKAALTDADYRAVLRQVVGVESSADCTPEQLRTLADHFKSFSRRQPPRKPGGNFYRIIEGIPHWRQKRHIAAMWIELGYSASALDTRAKKQFGRDSFTLLSGDDLQTLGRDLAKRLARRKKAD